MGFWIFAAIIALLFLAAVIEVLLMLFSPGDTCGCRCGRHHWMRGAIDDHR